MKKIALPLTVIGAILLPVTSSAQIDESVTVELAVTAAPLISVSPMADMTFTSDGVTATPTTFFGRMCFRTALTDIHIEVGLKNGLTNNANPSLVNGQIGDFVNYNLSGGVSGVQGALPYVSIDTRDYDLTSADTGVSICEPDEYAFVLNVVPSTSPGGTTRSIADVVFENNLNDGTTYVFADVITVTFEPVL